LISNSVYPENEIIQSDSEQFDSTATAAVFSLSIPNFFQKINSYIVYNKINKTIFIE